MAIWPTRKTRSDWSTMSSRYGGFVIGRRYLIATSVLAYFTREDFHGVVDALMRAWLVTQGKQRWGEKSPQHMFQWRAITQAFPDARVLHMLRDGRDVAVSWKNAPFGPRRYESIARRWVAYVEAGEACRQALGPGRFMEVRYESLLENSEHVVRTVSSFLNIDYSSQMIGFHEKQSHYPTDNRNIENLGRPIMKKNAGKWRDEMGSRDLQYFEAIAGPTLHALGYQRACSNPMGPKLGSSIMGQLENIYGKLSHRKAYMAAFGIWRMRLRLLVRSGK